MKRSISLAFILAMLPAVALAQPAPEPAPALAPSRVAPLPPIDRDAWLTPFPKAPADTTVRQGARTGSVVTRAECEQAGKQDRGRFVFVEALGRSACIRYHMSAETFPDKTAAVYLPGDKGGFRIIWRNNQYELIPEELLRQDPKTAGPPPVPDMTRKIGDPARNQSFAQAISATLRTPAIVLARQGTDSSSGWIAMRRTRWEVEITNRALDAIKTRHGIAKLHLVGQSGGGHLVGALAALRDDLSCVVAGSAPLALDPRSFYLSDKIAEPQRFFNPADHAAVIAKKAGLRLILVTDGRDNRVFVERQAMFVRALARSGAKAPQFFVSAGDALSHGVTTYSIAALRSCIAGKSDDEIALELSRMNTLVLERRLKAVRDREAREEQEKLRLQPGGASQTGEPAELSSPN
ncbi:MAG: hypothetical protein Q8M31_14690 [Beijerinckiaceae bacterium]|nr:hypothetical protein [Beijerinckiaceae bacterium]